VKAPHRATEPPPPAVPMETLAASEPSRQEHLARVLRSETFQQADRLKRFLAFVVTEFLEGRQDNLKEYVIGVQVFQKEESFDPRTDPIVRVQARRLRVKLTQYYRTEGRLDALIIDLPKGGYGPVFRGRDAPALLPRSVAGVPLSRQSVVVEALADHSPAGDLGAFSEAVRDELIHRISNLPGVRVLASRPDGDPRDDLRGPVTIVSGSVRQAGDRLRTTVNGVDAASRCYLWSEVIDTPRLDSFEPQDRAAQAVVERLGPERLGHQLPAAVPDESPAAHNLYLQGRYHLDQRTEEGLRKAVDFFEKALAEGAEFAPAHSGLADAYSLLAHYGVVAPAEAWTRAASAASAALMLDGASAEAHTSLAHLKATQDFDWLGAEQGFLRAIGFSPGYATAHHWYATSCLSPLGRLDEALEEMLTARSLDPVSSIVARDLARVHYYRRDFETALQHCDQTIELNPYFGPAYWLLGVIQEQRRDFDEAVAAFQRALQLLPNTPRLYGGLGRTLALAGRRRRARTILRRLEADARRRYVSPLDFAWIRLALGEEAAGFRWLAKACADRCFDLIAILVDPRFDPYRDDPRFRQLITRLGLGAG